MIPNQVNSIIRYLTNDWASNELELRQRYEQSITRKIMHYIDERKKQEKIVFPIEPIILV